MRDVSTGTCGGRITCNFLRNYCAVDDEEEYEKKVEIGEDEDTRINGTNDAEDPLFVYEEITSFLIALGPQILPQSGIDRIVVIEPKASPLRSSLFDHVSPYLEFQLGDRSVLPLPMELTRRLKWKLTGTTPKIVRKIVERSGYAVCAWTSEWCGSWCDATFAFSYKYVKYHQKVNHFPGAYEIGNKDRLCRNLARLAKNHGRKYFDFVPDTYVLPEDLSKIRAYRGRAGSAKWIVKPACSSCGRGIFLIPEFARIPATISYRRMIVQRYLSRPKLINGKKFDLRVYALVTSFDPLKIYVYREGLVRFACDNYADGVADMNNRYAHLTNYSVNRSCSRYRCNDSLHIGKGHKWSLGCLWSYLNARGVDTERVTRRINDIIVKTLISCESSVNSFTRVYLVSSYCCYELLGFDVLLDENAKPWLLEVNISPSLQTSSALDEAVKGPLIRDTLNIVGYQIPDLSSTSQFKSSSFSSLFHNRSFYENDLSRASKRRQTFYVRNWKREAATRIGILDTLTPDDVRHLMRYEDELATIGNYAKIFPTNETDCYFKYFGKITYYNLLLDAWEKTYGVEDDRKRGIEILRDYGRHKYHLIEPKGR